MRKFLSALLLALILTGCAKQKEVQIPSAAEKLSDGISAFSAQIVLDCDIDTAKAAFASLLTERADLFWVSSSYRYTEISGKAVLFPEYTIAQENAALYRDRFNDRAQELSKGISPQLPVADRALLLHDRLLAALTYDKKHSFPLADALLAGRADCEGYARAYQYLLQYNGIEAQMVFGKTEDIGHAWVIFREEDGTWYHADPAWNDGTAVSHAYFRQNDAVFMRTHTAQPPEGAVYPVCTGEAHSFFRQTGLIGGSEESVARAFDRALAHEGSAVELCFPAGLSVDTLKTLDENVKAEAQRRGAVITQRITAKNSMVVLYILGE